MLYENRSCLDRTEHHIIKGCIKGDRKAQNLLYQKYKNQLFGICLRYARNRAEAEDLLQDGFIRIFSDLYQYRPIGSFDGWLRKVMVNVALQHIRRRKRLFPIINIDQISEVAQVDESVFVKFRTKALVKMIQKLPAGYRAVFNMYVIEGFSHKEIATELNISENTSKSQLSRAKAALRAMIEKSITV